MSSSLDTIYRSQYTGEEIDQLLENARNTPRTATCGSSSASPSYFKISDFGEWGSAPWNRCGFSMLITSRAGETVWVSVSSNDSNKNAKALRLMNTHGKIANIYYSIAESAIYVCVKPWANNVNAHILSNVNGDYVPAVSQATALPADVVDIPITEFGPASSTTNVGDTTRALAFYGDPESVPTYNTEKYLAVMTYGTEDLEAGVSDLDTGTLYFVYE